MFDPRYQLLVKIPKPFITALFLLENLNLSIEPLITEV